MANILFLDTEFVSSTNRSTYEQEWAAYRRSNACKCTRRPCSNAASCLRTALCPVDDWVFRATMLDEHSVRCACFALDNGLASRCSLSHDTLQRAHLNQLTLHGTEDNGFSLRTQCSHIFWNASKNLGALKTTGCTCHHHYARSKAHFDRVFVSSAPGSSPILPRLKQLCDSVFRKVRASSNNIYTVRVDGAYWASISRLCFDLQSTGLLFGLAKRVLNFHKSAVVLHPFSANPSDEHLVLHISCNLVEKGWMPVTNLEDLEQFLSLVNNGRRKMRVKKPVIVVLRLWGAGSKDLAEVLKSPKPSFSAPMRKDESSPPQTSPQNMSLPPRLAWGSALPEGKDSAPPPPPPKPPTPIAPSPLAISTPVDMLPSSSNTQNYRGAQYIRLVVCAPSPGEADMRIFCVPGAAWGGCAESKSTDESFCRLQKSLASLPSRSGRAERAGVSKVMQRGACSLCGQTKSQSISEVLSRGRTTLQKRTPDDAQLGDGWQSAILAHTTLSDSLAHKSIVLKFIERSVAWERRLWKTNHAGLAQALRHLTEVLQEQYLAILNQFMTSGMETYSGEASRFEMLCRVRRSAMQEALVVMCHCALPGFQKVDGPAASALPAQLTYSDMCPTPLLFVGTGFTSDADLSLNLCNFLHFLGSMTQSKTTRTELEALASVVKHHRRPDYGDPGDVHGLYFDCSLQADPDQRSGVAGLGRIAGERPRAESSKHVRGYVVKMPRLSPTADDFRSLPRFPHRQNVKAHVLARLQGKPVFCGRIPLFRSLLRLDAIRAPWGPKTAAGSYRVNSTVEKNPGFAAEMRTVVAGYCQIVNDVLAIMSSRFGREWVCGVFGKPLEDKFWGSSGTVSRSGTRDDTSLIDTSDSENATGHSAEVILQATEQYSHVQNKRLRLFGSGTVPVRPSDSVSASRDSVSVSYEGGEQYEDEEDESSEEEESDFAGLYSDSDSSDLTESSDDDSEMQHGTLLRSPKQSPVTGPEARPPKFRVHQYERSPGLEPITPQTREADSTDRKHGESAHASSDDEASPEGRGGEYTAKRLAGLWYPRPHIQSVQRRAEVGFTQAPLSGGHALGVLHRFGGYVRKPDPGVGEGVERLLRGIDVLRQRIGDQQSPPSQAQQRTGAQHRTQKPQTQRLSSFPQPPPLSPRDTGGREQVPRRTPPPPPPRPPPTTSPEFSLPAPPMDLLGDATHQVTIHRRDPNSPDPVSPSKSPEYEMAVLTSSDSPPRSRSPIMLSQSPQMSRAVKPAVPLRLTGEVKRPVSFTPAATSTNAPRGKSSSQRSSAADSREEMKEENLTHPSSIMAHTSCMCPCGMCCQPMTPLERAEMAGTRLFQAYRREKDRETRRKELVVAKLKAHLRDCLSKAMLPGKTAGPKLRIVRALCSLIVKYVGMEHELSQFARMPVEVINRVTQSVVTLFRGEVESDRAFCQSLQVETMGRLIAQVHVPVRSSVAVQCTIVCPQGAGLTTRFGGRASMVCRLTRSRNKLFPFAMRHGSAKPSTEQGIWRLAHAPVFTHRDIDDSTGQPGELVTVPGGSETDSTSSTPAQCLIPQAARGIRAPRRSELKHLSLPQAKSTIVYRFPLCLGLLRLACGYSGSTSTTRHQADCDIAPVCDWCRSKKRSTSQLRKLREALFAVSSAVRPATARYVYTQLEKQHKAVSSPLNKPNLMKVGLSVPSSVTRTIVPAMQEFHALLGITNRSVVQQFWGATPSKDLASGGSVAGPFLDVMCIGYDVPVCQGNLSFSRGNGSGSFQGGGTFFTGGGSGGDLEEDAQPPSSATTQQTSCEVLAAMFLTGVSELLWRCVHANLLQGCAHCHLAASDGWVRPGADMRYWGPDPSRNDADAGSESRCCVGSSNGRCEMDESRCTYRHATACLAAPLPIWLCPTHASLVYAPCNSRQQARVLDFLRSCPVFRPAFWSRMTAFFRKLEAGMRSEWRVAARQFLMKCLLTPLNVLHKRFSPKHIPDFAKS